MNTVTSNMSGKQEKKEKEKAIYPVIIARTILKSIKYHKSFLFSKLNILLNESIKPNLGSSISGKSQTSKPNV